jgi:DNA (cytosine-5)-methyltransferase 1
VTVPKLLDLFCCQGGAGEGYRRAGFDVIGVDLNPQPRYPFEFHQADALQFLVEHGHEFDAIHASPPCQAFTLAQRIQKNEHPDLISPTRNLARNLLLALDTPYVIENVVGAPLVNPVLLCGAMFGLGTYRHRLFESNVNLATPAHPEHLVKTAKMGRSVKPGEMMHVVGNFAGVEQAKRAMGIDWMNRNGLREAIPPAYTEHIGTQLLAHIASAEQETHEEAS